MVETQTDPATDESSSQEPKETSNGSSTSPEARVDVEDPPRSPTDPTGYPMSMAPGTTF